MGLSSADDALWQTVFHRWQLVPAGVRFTTASSVLQPVFHQGQPAFLKLALVEEEVRGAGLMRWLNGDGAARVLTWHARALLLEDAGQTMNLAHLVAAGQDDKASQLLCAVAATLHRPRNTPLPALLPLADWCAPLLEPGVSTAAVARLLRSLLDSPGEDVPLHGDLHHQNIWYAGPERGWLAIDPKGLFGERTFDFASLFCNPDAETMLQPGRLERQLSLVAKAAQLQEARLLAWVVCWSSLSAHWLQEDGLDAGPVLALAARAYRLLESS